MVSANLATHEQLAGRPFGEIVAELEMCEPDDIGAALDAQREGDERRIGEILVDLKRLTREQVAKALSIQLEMPFLDKIDIDQIPDELVQQVPISFSKQHGIVPVIQLGDSVVAAVEDPVDTGALDDLALLLATRVTPVIALDDKIREAINRVYDRATGLAHAAVQQLESDDDDEAEDIHVDLLDEQAATTRRSSSSSTRCSATP